MALVRNYGKWAISGLLLGVGFVVPSLWIVGLLGGLYFIHLLHQAAPPSTHYFGAWLAWTIKASLAVWWFWSTYPIDWLPAELGNIQLFLIGLYWFTTALWLGAGALFLVWLFRQAERLQQTIHYPLAYLLLPFGWVLSEGLGSLVFSLFFIGPGGGLNTAFSFGYSGYLLAEHPGLLPLAGVAGVYALSFVFALIIVLIYVCLVRRRKYLTVALLLLFIYLTSFITPSALKANETGYRVITIDTDFESRLALSDEEVRTTRASLTAAVEAAMELQPDYLILPEDSRYFDHARPVGSLKSQFQQRYDNPPTVFIDSSRAAAGEMTVLQALIYSGPAEPMQRVYKRYLVPQGEYMPTLYEKAIGLFGFSGALALIADGLSYQVGPEIHQGSLAASAPAILFCFESVAPRGVRAVLSERPTAPFVAHIVSHAWFNEPNVLWLQLDRMLQVQAVWNQEYIVSAGNQMTGQLYTPAGTIEPLPVAVSGEGWKVREVVIPRQ